VKRALLSLHERSVDYGSTLGPGCGRTMDV